MICYYTKYNSKLRAPNGTLLISESQFFKIRFPVLTTLQMLILPAYWFPKMTISQMPISKVLYFLPYFIRCLYSGWLGGVGYGGLIKKMLKIK